MQRDEPRVIDAKFKVVKDPRRWSFFIDWRVFSVIALGATAGFVRFLADALR